MLNFKKVEDQIIEEHKQNYYYIISIVRDEQAAEDISQTAVMKALSNIGSLKNGKALKSWLKAITVNEIKLYFRSLMQYKGFFVEETDMEEELGMDAYLVANDIQTDILQHLVSEEEQSNVIKAMTYLDEKYEIIIRLHVFGELKLIEIADLMKINVNTVRTRYVRGLKQLREVFEKIEKGEEIA